MKTNKKGTGLLTACGVGMMAVCSAHADTDLTINIDTAYIGYVTVTPGVAGGVTGSVGINNEGAYLSAFQATYAGGDALPHPTSNPFYTFCVDILPDLVNWNNGQSSGWSPEPFSSATPSPNGAGQTIPYVAGGLQTAASLYNGFVGNVDISSPSGEQWGAALQLAIWQVLYGNSFSVSGVDSTVAGLEADILNSTYNFANPNISGTFWDASNPTANQDLIGPPLQTGFVPEPGAYGALAGAGLLVFTLRSQSRRKLA